MALTGGVIVTALLAWLIADRLMGLEVGISSGLASLVSIDGPREANTPGSVRTGLLTIFSICAVAAGYKLSGIARILGWLQLLALSLVLALTTMAAGIVLNSTTGLILAASIGVLTGGVVANFKEYEKEALARNREVESLSRELGASEIQIIKDDEIERRVLAGDLHDQVLNDLKFLRQKLDEAGENLDAQKKQELDELLSTSMQNIRDVMDSLSPAILEHVGFGDACEDLIRKGAKRSSYKVRFKNTLDESAFNAFNTVELTLLYRLVQEAVTNICKHAEAKTVRGSIVEDNGDILISITDDGRGIPNNRDDDSRGLRYMRQRASIIGANVRWNNGKNDVGTEVLIRVPQKKVES